MPINVSYCTAKMAILSAIRFFAMPFSIQQNISGHHLFGYGVINDVRFESKLQFITRLYSDCKTFYKHAP